MGGCRGVIRGAEGRKTRGGTRQTHIGSQGGASVIIFDDADGNGCDVGDSDGAGWWRG